MAHPKAKRRAQKRSKIFGPRAPKAALGGCFQAISVTAHGSSLSVHSRASPPADAPPRARQRGVRGVVCPQCEHRLQPPAFPPAPLRPSTAHRAMSPKQAPHRMPVVGKGRRARQRPGKNLALRPALESSVAPNPRCLTNVSISGHLNLHVCPAMCSAAPAGPCGGQPAPKHGRSSASTLSLSPRSRAPQLSHRLALTAAPARPLIRPLQGKNRTAALERLTAGASPPASLGAAEFDSPVNGAHWSTFWPRGKVCGSRQASKLAPPRLPPPPRPHSPGPLPPTLSVWGPPTSPPRPRRWPPSSPWCSVPPPSSQPPGVGRTAAGDRPEERAGAFRAPHFADFSLHVRGRAHELWASRRCLCLGWVGPSGGPRTCWDLQGGQGRPPVAMHGAEVADLCVFTFLV